jgi:Ner family transcriptional regulator
MPKKPTPKDWNKEDIKAAVWKTGTTMKGLALANGYRAVDSVNQALFRPYPKAERIIANAIGEKPETIWPSRYEGKFNGSSRQRNVNLTPKS